MIAADLRAIAGEDLKQLRARWARRWGDCPRLRSVALLRHIIAWRLQVEASGGLDAATRRMLLGRAAIRGRFMVHPGRTFMLDAKVRRHK